MDIADEIDSDTDDEGGMTPEHPLEEEVSHLEVSSVVGRRSGWHYAASLPPDQHIL